MLWLPLTILSLAWTALKWVAVLILLTLVIAFLIGGVKTLQWLASFVWPRKPNP